MIQDAYVLLETDTEDCEYQPTDALAVYLDPADAEAEKGRLDEAVRRTEEAHLDLIQFYSRLRKDRGWNEEHARIYREQGPVPADRWWNGVYEEGCVEMWRHLREHWPEHVGRIEESMRRHSGKTTDLGSPLGHVILHRSYSVEKVPLYRNRADQTRRELVETQPMTGPEADRRFRELTGQEVEEGDVCAHQLGAPFRTDERCPGFRK